MGGGAQERRGHQPFEHTADVGVRAWGASLGELFEEAARGLISLMVAPETVRPASVRTVSAEGEEPDELLVAWLNEIVFAFDAEHFAPAAVRVVRLEEGTVTGELRGEELDRARHEVRHSVKAVTYHGLAIREAGDIYEVRVIFDV